MVTIHKTVLGRPLEQPQQRNHLELGCGLFLVDGRGGLDAESADGGDGWLDGGGGGGRGGILGP